MTERNILTQNYNCLTAIQIILSAQASSYKVHSREITYKSSKGEQQFLNARHPLDLLYIYTIYYQNISKDIKVIERTSFPL